jgi:hypothetical protein
MHVSKGGESEWSRTTSCQNGSKRACRGYRITITADSVPNSEKFDEKWRFLRDAEEGDASERCVIADLDSSGHLHRLRT